MIILNKTPMNDQNNKRRSRYKREQEQPRPGKFQTKGDAEIILLIHEYRYLTRNLLELLTGRKGTSLKNRLRFLYDNGYIWKVQFSRAYTETGSTPDIYVLDDNGSEVYQELTGKKPDPSPKRNQNKDPQLEHSLLVNTIRAIITNACNQTKDIELLYWQRPGNELKDSVKVDGQIKNLVPDSFFVLKKSDGKIAPFFIEADRSTMDQPTFTEKLKTYYAYYQSIRSELDNQKGTTKKEVSNKFKIHGFRVLTIIENELDWQKTRNKDRLSHLIESGYKATEGKGWRGFWYTTKDNFNMKEPSSILKSIWYLAHDTESGKTHSIIE